MPRTRFAAQMRINREGMDDADRVRGVCIEGTPGLVGHLHIRERKPRFAGEANLQIAEDSLQVCQPHRVTHQARRHGACDLEHQDAGGAERGIFPALFISGSVINPVLMCASRHTHPQRRDSC
jgi:hypothetical protein